jgi:hypothetical protein
MNYLDRYHKSGRRKTKDEILESELTKHKVKCKCGHTLIIIGKTKVICNHCGYYVYRDEREEFKDKMRSALNG